MRSSTVRDAQELRPSRNEAAGLLSAVSSSSVSIRSTTPNRLVGTESISDISQLGTAVTTVSQPCEVISSSARESLSQRST